jgi:autotransporter translocation and assembly factor TamB
VASSLRRRILKISAIVLASLLGLVGLAVGGAVVFLQGERMGAFVAKVLPEMKGKMEFRSIRWPARLLIDILAKRPTPFVIEGVKFYDPEGSVVLDVPHLTVALELHQLINGGGLFMHDMDVGPNSYWRFGRMQKTKKGIGFLEVFKMKNPGPPSPPKPPGSPPEKGFAVRIFNAQLNGLRVVFDFPHVWGFDLRDVHSPAWLQVEDGFCGWEAKGLEARAGGFLTVLDQILPFDSVKVKQVATLREYSDDIFLNLTAGKTGNTTLVGKGYFNGIYADDSVSAIHMHTEFHNAPDALNAVLKPMNIPGLHLAGDNAHVNADLMGPYVSIAINTDIGGLDVSYDKYAANNLVLRAGLQFDPNSKAPAPNTKLEELSFSPPGGGRFVTKLDLAVPKLQTQIKFDHFTVDSYLPAGLHPLAAGKLHGQLNASAEFDETMSAVKQGRLHNLNLTFDRTGKAKNLPRSVRISGQATASPEQASTTGLRVDIPGAGVEVKGKVEFGKGLLALGLRLATTNLPQLLATLGVQPLAQSATLDVDVSGTMDQPTASGQLQVKGIGGKDGIPWVPSFETKFRLQDGTAQVDSLSAQVASGSLSGSGSLTLFEKSVQHMLRSPNLQFRLNGNDIDLHTLIAGGLVSGKLAFQVTAQGPMAKPKIRFKMPAGVTVQVLGQTWQVGGIDAEVDKDGLVLRLLQVSGKGGGDIQIEGHMRFVPKTMPMEWHLRVADLPVEAILAAAQVDVPATGKLTIDLNLSGTPKAPVVNGSIDLKGIHAMGVDLGDASLKLTAVESGVALQGNLFGRFDVQGTAKLLPDGLHAKGSLSFAHVKLEEWGRQLAGTPELEDVAKQLKDLDLQSALSGQVDVAVEPGKPPVIHARLSEMAASIQQEITEPGGQVTMHRLGVKNDGDLRVEVAGDRIALEQFCLSADAGKLCVQGGLDGQAVHAKLLGGLDLELLQPLLRRQLQRLGGAISLEVKVGGTLDKPQLDGKLAISRPVAALPAGFDSALVIPSGAVILKSDAVELKNLVVSVGGATLTLSGRAGLGPHFTPTDLDVQVNGEVSATLLETLAPDVASDVTGRARIDAKLTGTLDDPNIAARIDLGEIQMRLRGISSQIAVESGTIELGSKEALLRNVKVRINNEGQLLIGAAGSRPGRLRIVSLRPKLVLGKVELPLKGERLGYRSSGIQIDDLAFSLDLTGDLQDQSLTMGGDVRLISGRYIQDFNVRNLMISPRINESDSRPFWEGSPLLEDLKLDLRVRTLGDGFIVQNNLAPEIFVQIDLRVGGTLSSPTLGGDVRPTEGRFHILGLRGDFDLVANVNHITFVPSKSLAAGDTPELNLEAQNLLTDAFGVQHTVQMRISGPISQATIDLSTAGGLDRNQTLMLLLSGRTSETTSLVGGPGARTLGVNSQSGLDMMGQASRDAVSNLIEPYIDDTLQILTGHKLNLRPTVGADGFELKVLARASRELAVEMSYLQGFQTQRKYRLAVDAWLRDYITGTLTGEYRTFPTQQTVTVQPYQTRSLRLGLTFAYPIRFLTP